MFSPRSTLLLIAIYGISHLSGKVEAGTASAPQTKVTALYHCVTTLPLVQDAASDPPPTWQELRDTLADESKPHSPRSRALNLACAIGEDESAHEILEIIGVWLSELEGAGTRKVRTDEALRSKSRLAQGFLNNCVAPLESVLNDQRPLLELLERFAVSKVLPGSGAEPVRAIAENPAPKEVRREFLLSIIAQRRPFHFDPALLSMFDTTTFPKLREFVRTSGEQEKLNRPAARILAHYGDQEILPELRVLHTRGLERSKTVAHDLETYIWNIEVQHPPSKLVDYIGSTSERRARPWAVRRAVELGQSEEAIRSAILAHAEGIQPVGGRKTRPRLSEIKRVGVELGVLHETDLPDVEVRGGRSTP